MLIRISLFILLFLNMTSCLSVLKETKGDVKFVYDRGLLSRYAANGRLCSSTALGPGYRGMAVVNLSTVVLWEDWKYTFVDFDKTASLHEKSYVSEIMILMLYVEGPFLILIHQGQENGFRLKIFELDSMTLVDDQCVNGLWPFGLSFVTRTKEAVFVLGKKYALRCPSFQDLKRDELRYLSVFFDICPSIRSTPWEIRPYDSHRPKLRAFLELFKDAADLVKTEILAYLTVEEKLAFLSLIPNDHYLKGLSWKFERNKLYYMLSLHLWRGEEKLATELVKQLLSIGDRKVFPLRTDVDHGMLHQKEIKDFVKLGKLSLILRPGLDWFGAVLHTYTMQDLIDAAYVDPLEELFHFFMDIYFDHMLFANNDFLKLIAHGNPYAFALMHLAFRDGRWGAPKSAVLADAFLTGADPVTIAGAAKK